MQGQNSRIVIALVLGASCVFAVSALVLAGAFTSSEAATGDRVGYSVARGTRKTPMKEATNPAAKDVPEAEYRERLARIRQLSDEGNFEQLVKEGDEIQDIWAFDGGERFAKLILEVLNSFGYSRISDGHPEVGRLSAKYAIVALERADSYSLESELYLLMRLGYFPDLPSFNHAEALKLRNSSKLWLHLLTRLERERDSSADPYLGLQKQLSAPEDPYWNDGGGSNPVAKAEFEARMAEYNLKRKWLADQYKLRNIAEVAEPWGTKFLAKVYSRPPFSREELNALLSQYPIAKSLRATILKARDDLASGHP